MKKNSSLMARLARFVVALVSFYLVFSPSAYALTPDEVADLHGAAFQIYRAYATALAYLPTWSSNLLQKHIGIWAYDPAGYSALGTFYSEVKVGTSVLGTSSMWSLSPYVNGSPASGCGASNLGYYNGAVNYTCSQVSWTRGYQGSVGGSVACSDNLVVRYSTFSHVYTCPVTAKCLTGGSGVTWPSTVYTFTDLPHVDGYVSGGFLTTKYQIAGCAVEVSTSEFSSFKTLPLPNSLLSDMSDVLNTLNSALGAADLSPLDSAEINAAKVLIDNGVAVDNGILESGTTPPPCDVWDCNQGVVVSTWAAGSESGRPIVVNASVTVNINNEQVHSDLVAISTGIKFLGDLFLGGGSTNTVDVDSFTALFSTSNQKWLDFSLAFSSAPLPFLNLIIPVSSATWVPCFDLSGFWSGMFAGSRPQNLRIGNNGLFCLTDFPNWNSFVMLLKCSFSFIVLLWGVFEFWDLFKQVKSPGLLSVTKTNFMGGSLFINVWWVYLMIPFVIFVTYFLYNFLAGLAIYVAGLYAGCIGACAGFGSLTSPSELVLMMNYLGVTQAFALYISIISAKWNALLFLNWFGFV